MAGLFDKIKKRAGVKGKADAEVEELELKKTKTDKAKKKESVGVPVKKEEKAELVKIEEKKKKQIYTNAYRILLRPVVSEKASVAGSMNVYTFRVGSSATKEEIKRAIRHAFGVQPKKIRIVNNLGKSVRARHGIAKRGDWKKALVTLPQGQAISVHEGV